MTENVLIVDDVRMFLELQKAFLKLSSVHVLTACNGAEALQVVKKYCPALIFMDLHMPVMNGAECCAILKADPVYRSIPVVMITTEGKEDDRALCFDAGCDDYLYKPMDRNTYLSTARKYLPCIDRRDVRAACRTKTRFRVFGITLSGEVLDVSNNGIYVAADYEMEIGTVMDLVFALPGGSGGIIQCKGRVAWLNTRKTRLKPSLAEGFGIEFIALAPELRQALANYIKGATE
ncbi:MAG: response regulator [Geobacteraceae bacterium]